MRKFLLAALLSCIALAAVADDCALKKIASTPLDMSHGLPLATVRIDDSERRFLISTGTTYSTIDPRVARELGFESLPVTGQTIYSDGEHLDRYVRAKRLRIDRAEITNPTLLLLPAGSLPPGVDGEVGADFLSRFDADFDFGHTTLNLFSPKHCKGQVVYWTVDYTTVPVTLTDSRQLFITASLDGRDVSAVIVTGSSRVSMSETSVSRIFDIDSKSPGAEPVRATAEPSPWRFTYRFQALSFEGVSVRHPMVSIFQDATARAFAREHSDRGRFDPRTEVRLEGADLTVGMSVLSSLHVYVSYDEAMIYISAAGAH